MKSRFWRVVAVVALLAAGCGTTPEREADRAADGLIDLAPTPEERAALERARDAANAEMREEARALDDEIRRLREENAALRDKLKNR